MRAAILDDYQRVALSVADWASLAGQVEVQAFSDVLPDIDAAAARLQDFEIVVAMRERTPFPKALIERLPRLKLIVTTGHRNAAIDVAAASARGVTVCGTEMLGYPTAELTWGLILSLVRRIPWEAESMRRTGWQGGDPGSLGTGVNGKTLGLLGLGKLGGQVAAVGRAFGMTVIAWSQNLTAEKAAAAGAARVEKAELLRRADVVSIHLVLGDRTRGLVGAADLALMKPTAYLVNTSRGPIVDESALVAALKERRIAGAALDVYDREPLPAEHPLRSLGNALLTPHLGYVTAENYRLAYGQAVDGIRAYLAGKPLRAIGAAG
ncbi:MAG: D-2-hydroxyacid dehydrogenase family protein [Alphaproteobacteria bacterium]|nr:D-2-hydroxyacid dehydrogenase family protein [Alphaproteobacteria bacterium]